MRLIPSWIVDIAKYVSAPGNIRPALASVHITDTRLEATNSYIAVSFELPEWKPNNYPTQSERVETLENSIIFPADTIKQMKFKANKNADILDKKWILVKDKDGFAKIEITDLDTTVSYSARTKNATFPNIRSFYEDIIKNPSKDRVAVDIGYMIDVLNVYKAMGLRGVIVETREMAGVVIKPHDLSETDSFAIVMPLKL